MIGPGVGVRGPHLVPLCPETYTRSFPRVGIVRFAQLHSPQVINRNFSMNDWDKQGMKFLDSVAGRWPRSGGVCWEDVLRFVKRRNSREREE